MGKCSLTVALPVISSLGIEALALPTALLSTHTVFNGYTFTDTTRQMTDILNHFDTMGEKFDCIFTGYLGSKEQIRIVSDFIDNHSESIIITDPVMGDNGKLYSGFDEDYPKYISELCKKSDIILPNLTEACLLTDTEFSEDISIVIEKLKKITKKFAITGVRQNNWVAVYSHSRKVAEKKFINRQFHGAGDVFSSTLAGFYTLGNSLNDSIDKAVKFTQECIDHTIVDKDSQWYGLRFEECLHRLYEMK